MAAGMYAAEIADLRARLDRLEAIVQCRATPATETGFFGLDADLEREWQTVKSIAVASKNIPVEPGDDADRQTLRWLIRQANVYGDNEPAG